MANSERTRTPARAHLRENAQIAARLRSYADLLEKQGDDGFRVRAYHAAADRIEDMNLSLRGIYNSGGIKALVALPTIGDGIAAAIVEILTTGRWTQLERLRGETTPERVFQTVPGIGPVLAERFATHLDAQTLEELEALLHDPKMSVPGLGRRRRRAILAALADRLDPIRLARRGTQAQDNAPSVSLLLDADALFRKQAAAGSLRKIAPRRFNPEGKAWLPILHLRRGDWHLTLLYSNTARAHDLGMTKDWVVAFYHQKDAPEAQCTIVTQKRGPLDGKRVVRGRENECMSHYANAGAAADASA